MSSVGIVKAHTLPRYPYHYLNVVYKYNVIAASICLREC